VFYWHRDPDPAWVRALQADAPPMPGLSHPELWWEPGDIKTPGSGQRWVIYNLVPVQTMAPGNLLPSGGHRTGFWDLRRYLEEERPCVCAAELHGTEDDDKTCRRCQHVSSPIRLKIYRTFMDRGYWAQPFWVIQGDRGGHPTSYNPVEKQFAASLGLPPNPPPTGALPYADLDARVLRCLQERDLSGTSFGYLRREAQHRREQMERMARYQRARAVMESIDTILDQHSTRFIDDLPKVDRQPIDLSASVARYVETGRLVA
jgi:hypothetical protein